MHNCKATRKTLTELALDERQLEQDQLLLLELEQCPACREEYTSVRNTLRLVNQTMQSASAPESFWPGYDFRLRQRLKIASESVGPLRSATPRNSLLISLRKVVTASVRVPVPIGALLVLAVGLSFILALKSGRPANAQSATGAPSVVIKTVEVPVTQDRVITRVVYREASRKAGTQSDVRSSSNTKRGSDKMNPQTPMSLVGFKPANDVKLTIIKGSYRDEK